MDPFVMKIIRSILKGQNLIKMTILHWSFHFDNPMILPKVDLFTL